VFFPITGFPHRPISGERQGHDKCRGR
jgi:hypothetical protein